MIDRGSGRAIVAASVCAILVAGCASAPKRVAAPRVDRTAQECLARAMYFESARSSQEGMLAVGTVVMNRVASPRYPDSVCAVVGQRNQFAPGVLTRPMGAGRELAMQTAYAVLRGQRHQGVRNAMFFHKAGLRFSYGNMNYTAIAGGNSFYEKVSRRDRERYGRLVTQADIRALALGPG